MSVLDQISNLTPFPPHSKARQRNQIPNALPVDEITFSQVESWRQMESLLSARGLRSIQVRSHLGRLLQCLDASSCIFLQSASRASGTQAACDLPHPLPMVTSHCFLLSMHSYVTLDMTPKAPPQPRSWLLCFPLMSMAFSWPAPSSHSGGSAQTSSPLGSLPPASGYVLPHHPVSFPWAASKNP